MSADVMKTGMSSELEKFKASVTNTTPALYGKGKVTDTGLFYVKKGVVAGSSAWASNIDLESFQLKLNKEGITNINKAYWFDVMPDSKIPFKTLQLNTLGMRLIKWDAPALRIGDVVELYVWKNGQYVQYGYKKAGQ